MRKLSILIVSFLVLVAALVLRASPAEASATTTRFTALDAACSITPGIQWVSGNVLHIRGEVDAKRIASSDPRVNGSEHVVVNLDVNLTNGNGAGWGTFVIRPDTIKGTWNGTFSGTITTNVFAGYGVGQGTGVLQGYKLTARFQEIQPPADEPCAPAPALDADRIAGTILSVR